MMASGSTMNFDCCSVHAQQAVLFCTTCAQLICSSCVTEGAHTQHSIMALQRAIEIGISTVELLLPNLLALTQQLEDRCNGYRVTLREHADCEVQRIRSYFDALVDEVKRGEERAERSIRDAEAQMLQHYDAKMGTENSLINVSHLLVTEMQGFRQGNLVTLSQLFGTKVRLEQHLDMLEATLKNPSSPVKDQPGSIGLPTSLLAVIEVLQRIVSTLLRRGHAEAAVPGASPLATAVLGTNIPCETQPCEEAAHVGVERHLSATESSSSASLTAAPSVTSIVKTELTEAHASSYCSVVEENQNVKPRKSCSKSVVSTSEHSVAASKASKHQNLSSLHLKPEDDLLLLFLPGDLVRVCRPDPHSNHWVPLQRSVDADRIVVAQDASIVSVGKLVYATGGTGGRTPSSSSSSGDWVQPIVQNGLSDAAVYDPALNTWQRVANMRVARHAHAMVALSGYVYAVGGRHSRLTRREVERYDGRSERWEHVSSLNDSRADHVCVVLNKSIIAIGGSRSGQALSSCEIFDGQRERWSFIASMNIHRANAAAASWRDTVLVFGGTAKGGSLVHAIEQYDPKADDWTRIEERMKSPRSGHSAAVWRQLIVIVGGGGDHRGSLPTICFDPARLRFVNCDWTDPMLPRGAKVVCCRAAKNPLACSAGSDIGDNREESNSSKRRKQS